MTHVYEHDLSPDLESDALGPSGVTVEGLRRLLLRHLITTRCFAADVDCFENVRLPRQSEKAIIIFFFDLVSTRESGWSAYAAVVHVQLNRLRSLRACYRSVTPCKQSACLLADLSSANVFESSDEALFGLSEDLLEGDLVASRERSIPDIGIERVLDRTTLAILHGGQLEKVAGEDDLETSKRRRPRAADLSADLVELVEEITGDHGDLIHQ